MHKRKSSKIDEKLGARLREVRVGKKLSQPDMAFIIDVSVGQYQKYETGETKVSAATLYTIMHKLGVPCSVFFDDRKKSAERAGEATAGELRSVGARARA